VTAERATIPAGPVLVAAVLIIALRFTGAAGAHMAPSQA
jgi:hypothetical protein